MRPSPARRPHGYTLIEALVAGQTPEQAVASTMTSSDAETLALLALIVILRALL